MKKYLVWVLGCNQNFHYLCLFFYVWITFITDVGYTLITLVLSYDHSKILFVKECKTREVYNCKISENGTVRKTLAP